GAARDQRGGGQRGQSQVLCRAPFHVLGTDQRRSHHPHAQDQQDEGGDDRVVEVVHGCVAQLAGHDVDAVGIQLTAVDLALVGGRHHIGGVEAGGRSGDGAPYVVGEVQVDVVEDDLQPPPLTRNAAVEV